MKRWTRRSASPTRGSPAPSTPSARLHDEQGRQLVAEDGAPIWTGLAIPTDQVKIEDSWHVSGLQGTGSPHYRANDLVLGSDYEMPFGDTNLRRGST